jgi:branched-chain amino acid transport system permease protein
MEQFWQTFVNAIMLTMLYALISSGLTIVLGISGVLNFAHGAMYMLGGYIAYWFFEWLGLPFAIALILAFLFVGLLGALCERILFRRIYGSLLPTLIVALGLVYLIESGVATGVGTDIKTVSPFITGTFNILGATISIQRILVIVVSAFVMLGLFYLINRTKPGREMRATAQDSEAALLQGVNVNYIRALSMAIGCGLAGLAGALLAPVFGMVDPYMGSNIIFKAILVITIGGFGSVPGAFVGALLFGFVESFGYWWIGSWVSLVLFAIVIIVLLVRPSGILGQSYSPH